MKHTRKFDAMLIPPFRKPLPPFSRHLLWVAAHRGISHLALRVFFDEKQVVHPPSKFAYTNLPRHWRKFLEEKIHTEKWDNIVVVADTKRRKNYYKRILQRMKSTLQIHFISAFS